MRRIKRRTTLGELAALAFISFVAGYLIAAVVVARHWGWLP